MAITRLYVPRLWWPALIAHIFYCGGMAATVIASVNGNRLAEWALIAQLSPGMLKGLNRATLAKAALPEYESWFKRHSWVHAIWVPLGTWVWLYRAGFLGLRQLHRVARPPLPLEAPSAEAVASVLDRLEDACSTICGYNPCVREDQTWPRIEARKRKSRSPRKRSSREPRFTRGRARASAVRARRHQEVNIRGSRHAHRLGSQT